LVYKKVVEGDSLDVQKMQERIRSFLTKPPDRKPDGDSQGKLHGKTNPITEASAAVESAPETSSTVGVKNQPNMTSTDDSKGEVSSPADAGKDATSNRWQSSDSESVSGTVPTEAISEEEPLSKTSAPVRREEPVFSGQPLHERLLTESQWHEIERERRRAYEQYRARLRAEKRERRLRLQAGAASPHTSIKYKLRLWRRWFFKALKLAAATLLAFYVLGLWAEGEKKRRLEAGGEETKKERGRNWIVSNSPKKNEHETLDSWSWRDKDSAAKIWRGNDDGLGDQAPKSYTTRHRWWWGLDL
jgi:hypothetical protein